MPQDQTIQSLPVGVGMLSTDICLIIKDAFGVPTPVYMTLAQLVSVGGGGGAGTGLAGAGSPQGVQVGNPGQTYIDTTAHSFWVKETGVGTNTGWTQLIA